MFPLLLPFLPAVLVIGSVLASPIHPDPRGGVNSTLERSLYSAPAKNLSISVRNLDSGPHCFPAIGFKTPSNAPSSLDGWWCDPSTEYAFMGFSYAIASCEFCLIFFFDEDSSFIDLNMVRRSERSPVTERFSGYSQQV